MNHPLLKWLGHTLFYALVAYVLAKGLVLAGLVGE